MSADKSWNCTVHELAQATSGQVLSEPRPSFRHVGTDTRQSLAGKLFVPLKGENFDAHNFVGKAVDQGASVVLVGEWREEWKPLLSRASFVQVKDSLQALQEFARYWRRKHKFNVLAITGSNGKTSTKEFAFALLKPHFKIHASKGSFNNHWGVPLSILEAGPEHTHLILEMGMNHAGEIFRLCQIAEPDIAVVTTVGRAHIGELGSQTAVAQAKEEIYVASPKAVHVFNMDNEWTMRMQTRSHTKQILFSSFRSDTDVSLRAQTMNWDGLDVIGFIGGVARQIWVPILGRHNIVNLMTAAGLGLAVGLSPDQVWDGLAKIRDSAWGRNQIVPLKNGARVLFDAYNANPDSVQALLKNLFEMDVTGRKFLVLGDMRELGSFTDKAHEEIGEKAAAVDFEAVWYIGQNGPAFWRGFEKSRKAIKSFHSSQVDPRIAADMLALLREGDLIAIKASRGMALEHVLDDWPLSEPLGHKP